MVEGIEAQCESCICSSCRCGNQPNQDLEERDRLHGGVMPHSSWRSSIFGMQAHHVEALGQHLPNLVFEAEEHSFGITKRKHALLLRDQNLLVIVFEKIFVSVYFFLLILFLNPHDSSHMPLFVLFLCRSKNPRLADTACHDAETP